MKIFLNLIALIISISTFFDSNAMIIGTLETQVKTNNYTEKKTIFYATETQMYTTGGTTFVYPAGTFASNPIVQASVHPTTPHPNTEIYAAEISTNSNTYSTIMVYKVDATGVNEAPNGSVEIYLLAIGN